MAVAGKMSGQISGGAAKGGTAFNRLMIYALIALAFLGPLPLGSNRPVAWAFWAAVIGLGLALHLLLARQRSMGQVVAGLGLVLALALVQPIWGLVQVIPGLGYLMGGLPEGVPEALRASTLSLAPEATVLAVMRMLAHVALFVLVLRVVSRASSADRLLQGVFYGITLHAVWAMVNLMLLGDAVIWGEKTAYLGTATGTFVNRNSFASYLGMGLVLGLVLIMDRDHHPRMRTPHRSALFAPDNLARLAMGLCLLLIFIALLATQSRAGLASSLAGMAVAGAVMARARSHHADRLAPGHKRLARAILAGIAALGLLFVLGQGVLERGIFTAADSASRGQIYANAWARIQERPILGYGLDSFPIAYELGRSDDSFDAVIQVDAHSTYLENWVEGGVIFGSAMLLAALAYLRRLWDVAGWTKHRPDQMAANAPENAPHPPQLIAAALGVMTLAALHALVDFSFEIEANVMVLTILLALGVAPLRQKVGRI